MARTVLTVQETTRAGLAVAFVSGDTANGHSFDNSSHRVMLEVKNAGGSPINVTIETVQSIDGNAVADLVVVCPATTGDVIIGPFRADVYDQTDKTVNVDLSDDTSVTIGAIMLGEINF